ncbi:MAG TPA: hypothetical protein PKD73_12880 [Burkholderiaceae bacterium]|nr:hypothetical protein [Burkholderiaceae bacterium]
MPPIKPQPRFRHLLTSLILFLCVHGFAHGTTVINPPRMTVWSLSCELGFSPYSIRPCARPYAFSLEVSEAFPYFLMGVDLYLGLFETDMRPIASWVSDGSSTYLVPGLSPLARNFKSSTRSTFSTLTDTPGQLTYTLTGTERPGWYLLGGIMVFAGQDPLNPLNWLVVSTVPLRVP